MKNDAPIGKNRTGIDLSPVDKRDLLEVTEMTPESTDAEPMAITRAEYLFETALIGSVPPPGSVKGIAATGIDAIKGVNAAVLIDKLGERLAFERTGARLYETIIEKTIAEGPPEGGPSLTELETIYREERAHFELVRDSLSELGGDPTAMTPSADVVAVASTGILQVVNDARMTLKQSLEAMLIAELVDNDGWTLLIELTRSAGHDALVERFELAREREEEHLEKLRRWVTSANLALERPRTALAH
jgi:ferritin-like protein